MSQRLTKILSAVLVIIILCMNSGAIASYAAESYKKTTELETQGTSTNNENVECDVYYAGKKHSNTMEVSAEEKIYVEIGVKNAGYLENAQIDFSDCNFNIADTTANQGKLQSVDTVNKIVTLNKIAAGNNVIIELKISPKNDVTISPDIFDKDSTVKMTGTYINSNTKQVAVKKDTIINAKWHGKAELELTQELERYIPYAIEEQTGLLVQAKINLNVKEDVLPIEQAKIETLVPTIEDAKPSKVLVYARKTKATNNQPGTYFTNDNYSYDETTGIVTINVANQADNNGLIQWKKSDTDEYLVTYIYSEDVYEKVKNNTTHIEINTIANCKLYNDVNTEIQKESKLEIDCNKKINEIVNINANIQEESVSKGYMYSNKTAEEENRNETIYNLEYTAEISYAELLNKITIEENSDKFLTEDGTENNTTLAGKNYVYTKKVTVNKQEFEKILGNEGYIKILSNNTSIGIINKDAQINDQGNVVIDISSYNANSITIETSNPISEGELKINLEKAVSTDIDYTKNQIEKFKQIKSNAITTVLAGQTAIETLEIKDTMSLTEPTSKAIISINKETLSTVIENKDIEIKAILETDSKDDLLYKNPTLYINLPKYVSNINIKSAKALYEDELTVKSVQTIDMGDYNTIKVEIEGTQTKYNDSTSKGVNVLIYADIDVNKATPSVQDTITMAYTNENDTVDSNSVFTEVNFTSPKAVVTVNSISGYSTSGAEVTLAGDESGTALLDIYGEAKTATVKGQIINNYDNSISEVKILGRIPNKETTNYDSSETMGNTFDTTLNGAINLTGLESGYTVYYSTKADATKDLTDANNGWNSTVSDYSLIKSYLIVLDNELATTTNIEWTYGLNIPADLGYKNSVSSNYKVYLKNNAESGTVEESKAAPTIKLGTEKGPELNVILSSCDVQNGGTVTNGKKIKFYIEIENTGSNNLNNVKAEIPVPKGMKYNDKTVDIVLNETTGCVEYELGNLSAGEIRNLALSLNICEVTESEIEARVSADEFEGYVKNDKYTVNIIDADIALINYRELGERQVSTGETVEFALFINNLTEEEIKNVVIEYQLPKGFELNELNTEDEKSIKYNLKDSIITIEISKLSAKEEKYININTTVKEVSSEMNTIAKTIVNGKEYTSNVISLSYWKSEYTLTATNPGNDYIATDDEIVSEFTIENTGELTIYDTVLTYHIPEGTTFISASVEDRGETYNITNNAINNNTFKYTVIELAEGSSAKITINLKVDLVEGENEQRIESVLETTNERLGNKQSPTLTYIMKKAELENDNNKESNNEEVNNEISNNEITEPGNNKQINYYISGKIWIDANKNGEFDNQEKTVTGINILLINKETNVIQTSTVTNNEGKYVLDNIENGKYMVAFLYDTSRYTITEYQKGGVSNSLNSDAINSTIKYNGTDIKVGLTDTIEINNEDINNIDIGIYETEKFDLSLQKYVNKITINNNAGVVTYDYTGQNKTLTKVDIPAKYMNESTVIIEYKLVVKNEGDVAGYARKIVDYLPNDLKFNSELNKQAYLGKDGNIYSEELAQTIINPGEIKEITLILTKQMTTENTGTIVNKAEIAEDYNDLGLEDVNSTPGNNNEKENDLAYANAIITVKTGQAAMYTALILGVIAILAIGIYTIKKYVIKN